ncbi:MAG: hypothetical protein FWF53_10410 [Candidatus Azobacteroides sp.]|nr:hypothetical protein [Candidatus Azobacteroides sp.]
MNTKIIFIFLLCVNLSSCSRSKTKQVEANTDTTTVFSQSEIAKNQEMTDAEIAAALDSIANSSNGKSLNDIRFSNWTEKDWYDNDYFRFLRKYFDSYYKGEIKDSDLEPYKSLLNGKFVVIDACPFIGGGMFINIAFLDAPNKIFTTNVYSDVDEISKTVTGNYRIKGFKQSEEPSRMTKEEIFEIIKEHPENKLW